MNRMRRFYPLGEGINWNDPKYEFFADKHSLLNLLRSIVHFLPGYCGVSFSTYAWIIVVVISYEQRIKKIIFIPEQCRFSFIENKWLKGVK